MSETSTTIIINTSVGFWALSGLKRTRFSKTLNWGCSVRTVLALTDRTSILVKNISGWTKHLTSWWTHLGTFFDQINLRIRERRPFGVPTRRQPIVLSLLNQEEQVSFLLV